MCFMRNKILVVSAATLLILSSCKRNVLTGAVVHDTNKGLVYFPDAKNGDGSIIAGLGTNNYTVDTSLNTINFAIPVFRGGFSDFSAFAVHVVADNSGIGALIQSGALPQNTVALDTSSYTLPATDTISYKDGIMKG